MDVSYKGAKLLFAKLRELLARRAYFAACKHNQHQKITSALQKSSQGLSSASP